MADLFKEVIPSIMQSKKDVLRDEVDEKEYQPFLVNRALSYHVDCVLYANQMNLCPQVDKRLQYQYLLNTIRPMKRKFQPWQKAKALKDLDSVKMYFGYSDQKAKEAMRILSQEQIDEIVRSTNTGGMKKRP